MYSTSSLGTTGQPLVGRATKSRGLQALPFRNGGGEEGFLAQGERLVYSRPGL